MGWASGGELADNIWKLFRFYVPDSSRKVVAKQLIELFENMDCDTMYECEQLMKDAGEQND